jgi:hypothetical protein
VPCPLDGHSQFTLMQRTGAGLAARTNPAMLGHIAAQQIMIFVIDGLLFHTESTNPAAAAESAPSTSIHTVVIHDNLLRQIRNLALMAGIFGGLHPRPGQGKWVGHWQLAARPGMAQTQQHQPSGQTRSANHSAT